MIVFVKNPAAAAKSLQECPTLCDPIDGSPPRSPVPGILPRGKNTGVCCHFLFQCMKLKSENEVTQLCPTLSDPMDFSPPGSSIHGIFQARVLEWGAIAFSEKILGNVKKKEEEYMSETFKDMIGKVKVKMKCILVHSQ